MKLTKITHKNPEKTWTYTYFIDENGQKQGAYKVFDDNRVFLLCCYKDDMLHGVYKVYDQHTLIEKRHYKKIWHQAHAHIITKMA